MFTTFYRVKRGDQILGNGGTTNEIQALSKMPPPVTIG